MGQTPPRLESTINLTRDQHSKHYITVAVLVEGIFLLNTKMSTVLADVNPGLILGQAKLLWLVQTDNGIPCFLIIGYPTAIQI